MGLISAHVSYLTQLKNEETFEQRIDLLRRIKKDTSTFEESGSEIDSQYPNHNREEYDKMVKELCVYQIRVQEMLIQTVKQQLDITDDYIITNAHEAYQNRKELYDHMNHEVIKKQKQ